MRRLLFLVAAAASFGLAPHASKWGVVTGSLALLALSMLLAMAASSLAGAIPAAAGAAGALGSAMLVTVSPAAAGAVLVGLAYAERTLRVREQNARLLHLGAAVLSGALAGLLTTA